MHPGFPPGQTAVLVGGGSRSGTAWLEKQDPDRTVLYAAFKAVDGNDWDGAVRDAVAKGAECVAVAGGDGTLRRAVKSVVDAGAVLGIVPTGTGNAVANELGIPQDPDTALVSLSLPGEVRAVDLGEVEGKPFVNVVTLGLTSVVARELRDQPKDVMGKWAYLPALVSAFQKARPIAVEVEAGGERFEGKALQVVVAVTRNHGGPFAATPTAAHDDGLLSAYVVTAEGRAGLLLYATAFMVGQHTALPTVWSAESAHVVVRPSIPRTFVVDGDRMSFPEAKVSAQKQALRVFVPGAE